MFGWRHGLGVVAGAFVSVLSLSGDAAADTGDLDHIRCLSGDTSTAARCVQSAFSSAGGLNSGLQHIQSVDLSPDGEDVYATSQGSDAIVHLNRNTNTGTITFGECFTGDTNANTACTPLAVTTPVGFNSGMNSVVDATVSPDGEDVYTVSQSDDAVAHFSRNTTTGTLTFVSCYAASTSATTGSGGACSALPTTAGGGSNTGFDLPSGIAISPGTGASVYVTGSNDDAIARFNRNPSTGALTWDSCRTGETASGSTGSGACSDLPVITANGVNSGIDNPYGPVVSSDGDSLYFGSHSDHAVAWFDRGPAGGLSNFDCVTGSTGAGPSGSGACSTAMPGATANGLTSGLNRTQTVALDPAGENVYTGSQEDDAIVHFSRGPGSELSFESCISGDTDATTCDHIPEASTTGAAAGLSGVQSVVVSPDGLQLYAAAYTDSAIATFELASSDGDPAWSGCVSGDTAAGPSGTGACSAADPGTAAGGTGSGLGEIRSLAVTADGLELVGGTDIDSSIVAAERDNSAETILASGPAAIGNDTTPTFTFNSDETPVVFQCRVDTASFALCSGSGTHTTAALADGAHTFRVRALNLAGTPDPTPVVVNFTVDTVAPDTAINSGPSGLTADSSPEFGFSAADASSFECRVDGGQFAACASPHTPTSLADGAHTFEVRATDAAGNVDATPASRSFEVDATAPTVKFSKKPKKTEKTKDGKKKRAKFKFSSGDRGVSFECSRDKGKDFKRCSSPYERKYKPGKHTFAVRAIDEAGNVGAKVVHKWKVKEKK
ncbi:MAG: Ig-like domain-containing protein [Solirubrobacterales bacterium]